MAYNTGNPSGSSDPRDLSDSSADIDTWATSTTADTHPDRLGVQRLTFRGMENEFDADQVARASEYDDAQADRAQRFDLFLANSGYQFVGDYAAGIELTEYNQVVRDVSGNLWRVSASTALPYTTTGGGLPEGGAFIAIGDADLAQNLISNPSTGLGALLVRGSVIYVDTITDLQALPTSELVDGQQVQVKEYHAGTGVGGGEFFWDAASSESDNGGTIIAAGGVTTGRWKRESIDHISAVMFGAKRDGTSDDSAAFSALANIADSGEVNSVYIPNYTGTYYLESTIQFVEPGVRIYGDAGPHYNRGSGRKGHITYNPATMNVSVLDLGGFRGTTVDNRADQWSVEGLSFLGDNNYTIDAMDFTSQTNGPDRGAHVVNCSARNMRTLVHIAPNTESVSLATLNIEKCNASNNKYAVFSGGNVLGLRFVGNEAEQNTHGCIWGEFTAGVTIEDNMLEGQPDTINLYDSTVGNRLFVSIKRNYFEANSGDFVIKLKSTARSEAEIGPNYLTSFSATDYLIIDNGRWNIRVKDPFPIRINGGVIRHGSEIFHEFVNSYKLGGTNTSNGSEIQLKDISKFIGSNPDGWAAVSSIHTDTVRTPFGVKTTGYSISGSSSTALMKIPMTVAAGDIVAIAIYMRTDEAGTNNTIILLQNYADQAPGEATVGTVADPNFVEFGTGGGDWSLVIYHFEAQNPAGSEVTVLFSNASGDPVSVDVAAIAGKNYGPIPAGGTIEITPYIEI